MGRVSVMSMAALRARATPSGSAGRSLQVRPCFRTLFGMCEYSEYASGRARMPVTNFIAALPSPFLFLLPPPPPAPSSIRVRR
jgi:hypothetical protein